MLVRIIWLMLLTSVPLMVQAQAYKCRQPDGSLSFQDRPCLAGAASSKLSLPPPSEPAEPETNSNRPKRAGTQNSSGSENSWQAREIESQRRRMEEETRAENQKTQDFNRMQRCNYARSQLNIIQMQRPVYSLNNKGERVYVEDDDRANQITRQKRQVTEACM
jgi:hypothetical protein